MAEEKVYDMKAVAAIQNRHYGERTCIDPTLLENDPPRLPTGVFSLDRALAGGLPIGMISIFKGAEDGGKTSLACNVMAMMPHFCWRCFKIDCSCSLPPIRQRSFWVDVEGTFNKLWASMIGCKDEDYLVGFGEEAEQFIGMTLSMLHASDCGLVIVDSMAALTSARHMEGTAYDSHVGVDPRIISPFVRRVNQRLIREWRRGGHPCLVIMTNQLRYKIGILFGNPETMPGGQALKHHGALWVRIHKKALTETDKKFLNESKTLKLVQRHAFSIEKYKVLVLEGAGEFVRAVSDIPEVGVTRGQIMDTTTAYAAATELGLLPKDEKKKDTIARWKSDRIAYTVFQQEMIELYKQRILEGRECQPSHVQSVEEVDNSDDTI